MSEKKFSIEDLTIFCKKKGFVFQAAEIYGGLSGFFDFGPLGAELKNNLKQTLWKDFIHKREDITVQDGSIITNPKVWEASGHLTNFGDLVATTKESKTKIRIDHFLEEKLKISAEGLSIEEINDLIKKHQLTYNGEEFEEVKNFNVMFKTQVGADVTKHSSAYLRPETCQNIFPNFKLVSETARQKLPFGIIQQGKSFRNEISPRDFIFRCREFEQVELEYFFNPNAQFDKLSQKHYEVKFDFLSSEKQDNNETSMEKISIKELLEESKIDEVQAYWLIEFYLWFKKIGLSENNLRVREHQKNELSHYSKATFDIDYKYPFGYKEMFGLAHRSNYDLTQHQKHSKSKLQIFDETRKEKIIPHVVEPSLGVERLMMGVLCEAYKYDEERENHILSFNPLVSPYTVAVFPLMNKPELESLSKEIYEDLIDEDLNVYYDRSGTVGRRYARQDEIGTPYCITVDYDSLEDKKVTIRDRDTTKQVRISIDELSQILKKLKKNKVEFSSIAQ